MFRRSSSNLSRSRRALAALVLTLMLSFGAAAAPQPAYAVLGIGDQSFTVIIGNVWQAIKDASTFAWEHGAAIAFRNASHYFANQVAYDTAVWLGSGGQGQQPLFVTEGWGSYLTHVGDAAAGDFLDTFANNNGYVKLGLCNPPNLGSFKLNIIVPLFQERKPIVPRCTLSKIQQEWSTYLSDPRRALDAFNVVLDPRQNELGIALNIRQNFLIQTSAQVETEKLLLETNRGLKSITEPITKFIKTPIAREEKQIQTPLEVAQEDFSVFTGDLAADALGTFTNTLAARLMKRLMEGDVPNPSGTFNPRGFGYLPSGGVEYAVQVNSSIATPQLVGGERIDVISEFSDCPDNQAFAAVNNCTLDGKFAQGLRSAQAAGGLTVQEAISKGVVNGGWVFRRDRPLSVRIPDAWYLSDLRKLRRARFIPVGWELAAEKFAGTDITLQQVADGFNGAATTPYYHLIDPNWVLKAPIEQCRIQGYGQQLEPQGGNRQQSCVDVQNCVAENADGTCQAWGYCTREKNIWRFNGDSCEFPQGSGYSPYATCQAFTGSRGEQVSYLQNSLDGFDNGTCTSDSVGCRWYSTNYNAAASTSVARYDAQTRLYLKRLDTISCDPSNEGCHQFLRLKNFNVPSTACGPNDAACLTADVVAKVTPVASTDAYSQYAQVQTVTLKEAPTFLNCYDADSANDSPLCTKYLKSCRVDEVGCKLYTPTDGSPSVPGIAGSSCPNECVGFNSYDQLTSFFDPAPTPPSPIVTSVSFIPTTAQSCPASASGCEEFTNVTSEGREYYSELRQCVLPGAGEHTYYTWVGSNLTGYQLRTWLLKAESTNPDAAPATTDNSGTSATTTCGNANHDDFTNGTNPDCKQFYDTTGRVNYRLASKTITASNTCTQYRATNVATQATCESTGGTWNTATLPSPACFYYAIPQEGRSCSAQFVGCREYRGPTSSNVRLVFPVSTFGDSESGVTADTSATGGWTPGANSTESVSAFGHSLDSGVSVSISKDVTAKLTLGKQYTLNFWVKSGVATSSISASLNTVSATSFGAPVPIGGDWQVYTLGPVTLNATALPTTLTITSSAKFFIDNIAFKEIGDTFFVRKGSWRTPATCQAPRDLRCTAYTDSTNTKVALTDFSKICKLQSVGCEALVNTQNSTSPRASVASSGGQTVTTPADTLVYRVYDATYACVASAKSCRRVGEPKLDTSGNVTDWTDTFVRLDPDTLDGANPNSPLCSRSENACQEFKDAAGTSHFFKDPGNGTCEYKQVDTRQGYDWYKKGTVELCNLVQNPSFEKFNDAGESVLKDGSFETGVTGDAPSASWAKSGVWVIATGQHYDGTRSIANSFSGGTSTLTQSLSVAPGQTYTARVWVKADAHLRRTLRVSGCGVGVADYSEESGVWEKLQTTFTPTTRTCTIALTTTTGADSTGNAFYDKASVTLADVFPGWKRYDDTRAGDPPLPTFTAHESVAGQYWGSTVLEIQSTDQLNSGVWSSNITLTPRNAVRYFVITARVYVPDIPRNRNMLNWYMAQRVSPGSSIEPGQDLTISPSDKGKWLTKQALIKTNPNASTFSVGVYTNGDSVSCTATSCRAGQVLYLDQVTVTESQLPLAYTCPVDQVSCKAFRDPSLTKQTYYYLDNTKLDRTSCSGRVGEKEGCLLFTDLSLSQLSWNSATTYAASQGTSVAPVSSEPNDSNTILKVTRDRVCGEWLSCQSEGTQFVNGKTSSVCYALGRCNAWGASGVGRCGNWVNPDPNPVPLSSTIYQTRDTAWSGQEYSGYSIPNLYPIDQLSQKNYSSNPSTPDIRLTYLNPLVKRCNGTGDPCSNLNSRCTDGTICQYEDKGITGNGPFTTTGVLSSGATASKACRVYPEADSPFPNSVVSQWQPSCDTSGSTSCATSNTIQLAKTKETGYRDTTTCQQGENCECFYQRATYTNGETLFYGLNSRPDQNFSIDGGTTFAATSKLKRDDSLLGLRGYCLEKDTSRLVNGTGADATNACLTWMPVDVVSGDVSIYDYAPEAGYQSSGGDTYYCSQARGYFDFGKGPGVGSKTSGYTIQSHERFLFGDGTGDCSGEGDASNENVWFCASSSGSFTGGNLHDPSSLDQQINESAVQSIYVERSRQPIGEFCSSADNWPEGALVHVAVPSFNYGLVPLSDYSYYEFNQGSNNTVQFGVAFRKSDGKLMKIYAHLDHTCVGSGGLGYFIFYRLREVCTESTQVAAALNNKAWTNRILGSANYAVEPTSQLGFSRARAISPYGRFIGQPAGLLVVSDRSGVSPSGNAYTTISTPYSCAPGTCGGGTQPGMCLQGTKPIGSACTSSVDCGDTDGICTGYFSGICSGNSTTNGQGCLTSGDCGTGGTCGSYRTMTNNAAAPAGRAAVWQLFAKEYSLTTPPTPGYVQKWSGTAWVDDTSKPIQDISNSPLGSLASGVPAAPVVKQVLFDPVTKAISEGGNGVTLQTSGGNFISGNVVLTSPAPVSTLFYAYNPNGEQMPLSNVRVDWEGKQDQSWFSGAIGKYKNHKHLCEPATVPICINSANFGKTCSADAQCDRSANSCDLKHANPRYTFGDSSQACIDDTNGRQGYFSFTRVYTCSTSSPTYSAGQGACVFTPSVFVQDNWGWCTNGNWDNGKSGASCNVSDATYNPCSLTCSNGWVKFNGQVFVRP